VGFVIFFIPKAFQSQIKEFLNIINLPKYTSASPLHLRKGTDPIHFLNNVFFFLVKDDQEHAETE